MDEYGAFSFGRHDLFNPRIHRSAEGMTSPVQCNRCGGIYDLGTVTVTQRYADCSVWNTPCCNRTADDREWKSLPDYRRITDQGAV